MKTIKEIEKELKKPFSASDIEWRISRSGITNGKPWAFCLAYIDARAAMDRLDEVVGIEKWEDSLDKVGTATICTLSLMLEEKWVSKSDGAEDTNIEAIKGGISGAFKRACSRWGIGRYLYGLTESFAKFVPKGTKGARQCKIEGKYYHWLPPDLPKWALPESEAKKASNELLETIDKVIAAYDVIGIAKVTLESLVGHSLVELDEEEIKTLRAYYPEYKSGKRNIQDDISGKDRDVKTKEINKQEDLI